VTEAAVVNVVVDSSGMQYAVIAGLRTETGPERLVIAYPNEESLRDLIAAPSIVALGFSSREEAAASNGVRFPTGGACQGMSATRAGGETETRRQRFTWAERRGETGSSLRTLARFLVTSYSHVATTVIAIFFSRNVVSAVIRVAMGSSV
jgi:hypothetical protein